LTKRHKGLSTYWLELIETEKGFTIQDNIGYDFYKQHEVLARVKRGMEVSTGVQFNTL
jgi:hypothetical protein